MGLVQGHTTLRSKLTFKSSFISLSWLPGVDSSVQPFPAQSIVFLHKIFLVTDQWVLKILVREVTPP